jgi:uncharacterized Fe-S cluster protein YjdI
MDEQVEDPNDAGRPRTRAAAKVYERPEIRVWWDASRCIHTGRCLRGLPEVFDVNARPWIDVSAASPERIAATIRTCPTGALRYDGSGVEPEQPDEPTSVEVRPNGPLLVRGRLRIRTATGEVLAEEPRVALCRCGASENKPFCDNSHRLIGFRDPAPGPAGPAG